MKRANYTLISQHNKTCNNTKLRALRKVKFQNQILLKLLELFMWGTGDMQEAMALCKWDRLTY